MDMVVTIIGAVCCAGVILAWFVLPASKAIVPEPSDSVLTEPEGSIVPEEAIA